MVAVVTDRFDRTYFNTYTATGFHAAVAEEILATAPHSVLEIGAARGYLAKILENYGVLTCAMDVSAHCWHTRVVSNLIRHDATTTPYHDFLDDLFDLAVSVDFLEHVPTPLVPDLVTELARVSGRGYHVVGGAAAGATARSVEWWRQQFATVAPDYPVIITSTGAVQQAHPVSMPIAAVSDPGLVKLRMGTSGAVMFADGWKAVDPHTVTSLPYPDRYADAIVIFETLEYLDIADAQDCIRECHRVLRPGGLLRVAVPDAAMLMEAYFLHAIREYVHIDPPAFTAHGDMEVLQRLVWNDRQSLYDARTLGTLLQKAGFGDVALVTPFTSGNQIVQRETSIPYPTIALVMEAVR